MNMMTDNSVPGLDEDLVLYSNKQTHSVDMRVEIEQGLIRARRIRAEAFTSATNKILHLLKSGLLSWFR